MSPPLDAVGGVPSAVAPPAEDGLDPFAGYDGVRPRPAGRPWLIANMVAGIDGSLAWNGRVGELSSSADRALFVRLRGLADGVLVGAGTVRAEGYGPVKLPDASRRARVAAGRPPVPPLVVVSRSLGLDWGASLWSEHADQVGGRPVVVTASSAPADALDRAHEHADVVIAGDEGVDLGLAMAALADRGMAVVLTEGGPTLLAELVAMGLLDELCLSVAPLFGGDPLTMAHREQPAAELSAFTLDGLVRRDDELFLRYLLVRDDHRPPEGQP